MIYWEKSDPVDVIRRLQVAGNDLGPVKDNDMSAARVLLSGQDIQQLNDAHLQAGLFQALSLGSLDRILPCIYETGRQGPQAALWVIGPPRQQDLPVALDQNRYGHLRVGEINPTASRADGAELTKTLGLDNRRAAARTKIDDVRDHDP